MDRIRPTPRAAPLSRPITVLHHVVFVVTLVLLGLVVWRYFPLWS